MAKALRKEGLRRMGRHRITVITILQRFALNFGAIANNSVKTAFSAVFRSAVETADYNRVKFHSTAKALYHVLGVIKGFRLFEVSHDVNNDI
jgi:hypothetical protein